MIVKSYFNIPYDFTFQDLYGSTFQKHEPIDCEFYNVTYIKLK